MWLYNFQLPKKLLSTPTGHKLACLGSFACITNLFPPQAKKKPPKNRRPLRNALVTRPVGTEQFPHILAAGFSYKEHERQNFKQAEQDHLEQEPHRPAVETMHLFRHEQHCVVNLEPPWSRINHQINSTTTVRFWRWCYKIQQMAFF